MDNQSYRQMLIKRSYKFSLEIMKLIDTFPQKDFSIKIIAQQLIRSATSVGANIIEAQSSSSKKDFVNFLHYALKSANETRYWLGLLQDCGKIEKENVSPLLQEVRELANLLGSSILSLKGKKKL